MTIEKVWFDNQVVYLKLDTGHIIGNPIDWFPRLSNATEQQRNNYELGPCKESVHWEELDEDLSLESFFDFKRELQYMKL